MDSGALYALMPTKTAQKKSIVCVYDPKTGKRGLSFPRMTELAEAAHRLFENKPHHIIVIEVRPGQGQP
jgi:hypothetical protein